MKKIKLLVLLAVAVPVCIAILYQQQPAAKIVDAVPLDKPIEITKPIINHDEAKPAPASIAVTTLKDMTAP